MINVDMGQKIKDLKGNVLPDSPGPDAEDATLGLICINALMAPDQKATVKEKLARDKLARKINDAEAPVYLSADDVKMIKDLVGEHPLPIVVGQAFDMLDPPEPEKAIEVVKDPTADDTA